MRNGHRNWGWSSGDGNQGEKVSPWWAEALRPTPAYESKWLGVRGWGREESLTSAQGSGGRSLSP